MYKRHKDNELIKKREFKDPFHAPTEIKTDYGAVIGYYCKQCKKDFYAKKYIFFDNTKNYCEHIKEWHG
jgi:hypothetical protein